MTSSAGAWLPDGSLFLESSDTPPVRPHRPWNQGDIFVDVPIMITGRTGAGVPKVKEKVCHAMLIGHTCSLRGGGAPAILQNVAEVRQAKDAEIGRLKGADPLFDSDFKLFPLTGLFDDTLWVVDFNVLGTTHYKHLVDRRIACLSLDGWAALQRRYAFHSLRVDLSIATRAEDLRGLWAELELWEEWCSRGFLEAEFDAWLSEPIETDCAYAGTSRRDAAELARDIILAEMPAAA